MEVPCASELRLLPLTELPKIRRRLEQAFDILHFQPGVQTELFDGDELMVEFMKVGFDFG